MPIVDLSRVSGPDNADQNKLQGLPSYGPGGIYHEKQVGTLCALHCVNNMMQTNMFSLGFFQSVADDLDRREREITGGIGLADGNATGGGFFNVSVVQTVLQRKGFEMEPVTLKDIDKKGNDAATETAYILNRREHWFALRRFGDPGEWFDLNSCMEKPFHYTFADLRFHIGDAVKEGYSVFRVRGPFPETALEKDYKKLLEAIQGCGRPGQGYSLYAGGGNTLGGGGGCLSEVSAENASLAEMAKLRAARNKAKADTKAEDVNPTVQVTEPLTAASAYPSGQIPERPSATFSENASLPDADPSATANMCGNLLSRCCPWMRRARHPSLSLGSAYELQDQGRALLNS